LGSVLPPHKFTEDWIKVPVPQTGKADVGFWPGVLQGVWPNPVKKNTWKSVSVDIKREIIIGGKSNKHWFG